MEIGVPREIKPNENRGALTPAGVAALAESGHHVRLQSSPDAASSLPDDL
ncbi:MAG: hypothetical protein P8R42_04200 [Candidatus Binatia bacterium]|nr:hypothetical protein [Candidatus Binatia bacterium]